MEESFDSPEPTFIECNQLESRIHHPTQNNQDKHLVSSQIRSTNRISKETLLIIEHGTNQKIEDFAEECEDGINTMEHDDEPLIIRGPPRQGRIHQFLSALKGNVTNTVRRTKTNNNDNVNPRTSSLQNKASSSHTDKPLPHSANSSSTSSCSSSSNTTDRTASSIDHHHHQDIKHNNNHRVSLDNRESSKCQLGILLAALSCVFFATTSLIVKTSQVHPMQLLAARGVVQGLLVIPIVISTKSDVFGTNKVQRSLLLTRGVLGSAALIMSFISIHMIPLADSSTVIFTSPVFVSIFACICLGELCTWFDILMIFLTILGVIFVSKPSFQFVDSNSWDNVIGIVCGLSAAMFTALAFIVLRQLKVHYSVTVLWFSTILACFGAVLTIALDEFTIPNNWINIMECIGVGICGFLGQILLTKALQIETATTVSIARTLDIVFAFIFQIILLHETPDVFSCLGSLLVISCVILTAFRKRFLEVQEKRNSISSRNTNNEDIRASNCSGNARNGNSNSNCSKTVTNNNNNFSNPSTVQIDQPNLS